MFLYIFWSFFIMNNINIIFFALFLGFVLAYFLARFNFEIKLGKFKQEIEKKQQEDIEKARKEAEAAKAAAKAAHATPPAGS